MGYVIILLLISFKCGTRLHVHCYKPRSSIKCKQSIIQFQWKCLHNIVYSEYRLQKMGKSNGRCHFCKNEIESLMHLFYRCHKIKHVLDELKHIFNINFHWNWIMLCLHLIDDLGL
jgi:hypothetical protein